MKRLTALLLAGVMMVGLVACGSKQGGSDAESKVEIADAIELLTKSWEAIPEDKSFYIVGGDTENMVEGKPGSYNLEKAEELGLENTTCYPLEAIEYIDDAATIIHGMNSNGFTAGAYHVTESANQQTVVDAIKDRTMNNRWMCGFPEKLIIFTVEDYVVSVFGTQDNLDAFNDALVSVYGDAVAVAAEEVIE